MKPKPRQLPATIRFPGGVLHAPNSYGAFDDHCIECEKRGEKQRYCGACGKWEWDNDICCGGERLTLRQFNALACKAEKYVKANYPSGEDRYLAEAAKARKEGLILDPRSEGRQEGRTK